MEKQVRVFHSHEEAEKADLVYCQSLTPQERLNIVREIIERQYPEHAEEAIVRVCRIIKVSEDV